MSKMMLFILKKQFIGGIYSRGRESLYILYASMITCKIHIEDQLSISGKLLRRSRLLIAGFPPGCIEWKQTPDIAQSSKKANLSIVGMQCFSLSQNWDEENQHRKKNWSASKVPFRDFIQNMSQAPSKCLSKWIKVDKWDYLKNPSHKLKNYFCLGFLWIPR